MQGSCTRWCTCRGQGRIKGRMASQRTEGRADLRCTRGPLWHPFEVSRQLSASLRGTLLPAGAANPSAPALRPPGFPCSRAGRTRPPGPACAPDPSVFPGTSHKKREGKYSHHPTPSLSPAAQPSQRASKAACEPRAAPPHLSPRVMSSSAISGEAAPTSLSPLKAPHHPLRPPVGVPRVAGGPGGRVAGGVPPGLEARNVGLRAHRPQSSSSTLPLPLPLSSCCSPHSLSPLSASIPSTSPSPSPPSLLPLPPLFCPWRPAGKRSSYSPPPVTV